MPAQTFAERHEEIGRLTRKWRVGPAYFAAHKLVQDFPEEADGYTALNLLICLTNNGGGKSGGLRKASPLLIDQAMSGIPDFTGSLAHGDMLRDQLRGLAHFPRGDSLAMTGRLPKLIQRMHASDPNRLACLLDAQAQLFAVEGNSLDYAYGLHRSAHQQWMNLGDDADPNWVHFNLVHWLRVSIKLWGRHHKRTRMILDMLQSNDKPPGAQNDNQIRIICMPLIGLRAYRWLETHRM